jgi:hypothetical protein
MAAGRGRGVERAEGGGGGGGGGTGALREEGGGQREFVEYDADEFARYFRQRPWAVVKRVLELVVPLLMWALPVGKFFFPGVFWEVCLQFVAIGASSRSFFFDFF